MLGIKEFFLCEKCGNFKVFPVSDFDKKILRKMNRDVLKYKLIGLRKLGDERISEHIFHIRNLAFQEIWTEAVRVCEKHVEETIWKFKNILNIGNDDR